MADSASQCGVKTIAARASHPSRNVRGFPALPVHRACGGMTLLARQRSQGVPHLPKLCADRDPKITDAALTVASGPNPARRAGWGRRPQRPGDQSAFARVSGMSPGDSPSRIAGCHWLRRNHPASSETLTFSMHTLWDNLTRVATAKRHALVQKLWTKKVPCGRQRKIQNQFHLMPLGVVRIQ